MTLATTRRTFIKTALKYLFSITAWGWLYRSSPPHASHSKNAILALRGQVALARDSRMAEDNGQLRMEVFHAWITRALEQLTQQRGPDAWRALFLPDDRVAIKVNALGGPRIATSPLVASAIALGLQEAGIRPDQIIIWDRSTRELQRANYTINEDGDGPLCFGTDRLGYEPLPRVHGSIGSCFSPILTRWATALISVPVLKDHDLSGVSLSVKNLFGVIHNPNKYHDSGCSPYLVDLLGCAEIQDRLRLVVCDAHRAQCQGGPAFVQNWAWPYGGLLVGADPVALDRIGAQILGERRKELGLPSLEEAGRPFVHIMGAAERGLGEGRLDKIQLHELA